jgi:phosphoglycerol geranylgeranyltransferase
LKSNKNQILQQISSRKGQIAVLIDPDKSDSKDYLLEIIQKSKFANIDYFFVGGSTVKQSQLQWVVNFLKQNTIIPIVLFPGDGHQISNQADAILYLSLLSGRNAEYLIGQHVSSALEVYELGIEVIPTAYILIEGGNKSSVAYVSQTSPIPSDQIGIAIRTALAGTMQGKQVVFFDAGSGALQSVPANFINEFRKYSEHPIIVGGGISSKEKIQELQEANVIVIGNKIENDIDFLLDVASFKQQIAT